MKLHFSMEIDAAPIDENLPSHWVVGFAFDDAENEIEFDSASAEGHQDVEWADFLKLIGKEADGDFVDGVMALADAHVELNLNDAYAEYAEQDD